MNTETALRRFRALRRRLVRELRMHPLDERVDATLLQRAERLPEALRRALWREATRRRLLQQEHAQ